MMSVNVSSSDTDDEDKRLVVNPTKCVHEAIAEAFGCEKCGELYSECCLATSMCSSARALRITASRWALAENSAVVCLSVCCLSVLLLWEGRRW